MNNYLDLSILDSLLERGENSDFSLITQNLFNEVKIYLGIEPLIYKFKINLSNQLTSKSTEFFNIGVTRLIKNEILSIRINEKYNIFFPFIILREIFNFFIPYQLKNSSSVQLVINQIIMNKLSKNTYVKEWRKLIRDNLKQYDQSALGFNRLTIFNRLESFFNLQKSFDPTIFFFNYIRKNYTILDNKLEFKESDIHNIFFDEFEKFLSSSMNKNDLVETIRCLIFIFNKEKKFQDFTSYKKLFQDYKESGELNTEISLRTFINNFDWIKKYSYLSPSYQINWKSISVAPVSIFLRFNPLLNKKKIFKIIENFPFFLSPKISRNGFSIELFGHVPLPIVYEQDLIKTLEKLKSYGYITRTYCIENHLTRSNLNLNYFKENLQKYKLLNPNLKNYERKYEIELSLNYRDKYCKPKLDILDFLIIDRIRFFSVTGLGFERRNETLQKLKSDLLNEILVLQSQIRNLKNILNQFHDLKDLKREFIHFLHQNEKSGFFSIRENLLESISIIEIVQEILKENPNCRDLGHLKGLVNKKEKVSSIEKILLLKNTNKLNLILREIFSSYFKNRELYEKKIRNINKFLNLIDAFHNLKLFNLKTIEKIIIDQNLVEIIFKNKEEKLKNSYEKYKPYKINNQRIDIVITKLLNYNPPIIQPRLINTVITSNYVDSFLIFLLNDTQKTGEKLQEFKNYFIEWGILKSIEIFSGRKIIYLIISIPLLTRNEKNLLYSIIYNNFKEDIIYGSTFLWSGFNPAFSLKSFYDFDKDEFFYTNDLFEHFFQFIKMNFGELKTSLPYVPSEKQWTFWQKENNILKFITNVNKHATGEKKIHSEDLKEVEDFHLNLKENLININNFKEMKKKKFFQNFIKAIRFIPSFQNFGFGQYYLYFCPNDIEKIDLKLLLNNSFQKVEFSTSISTNISLLIKFINPFSSPNLKYMNWLTKSKKLIQDYCVFAPKKIYQIFHFDYNYGPEGWKYDIDKFMIYMQNILFNPKYNHQIPKIKKMFSSSPTFNSFLGPESSEYKSLIEIYNTKSLDAKSYLATTNYTMVNHFISLLKKNLIFPYLTLKNFELHHKIFIVLPDLTPETCKILIKIFSFFNYGFIFEIEGEYFIYGFPEEKKFENGIMIKLYLPRCELDEFLRIFDLLFEYLDIEDYIILNDLVDGKELLKSIYNGLDFLKDYNPLKNLNWNPKDKKWMNHKLFTQKFEPIYPDLIHKD